MIPGQRLSLLGFIGAVALIWALFVPGLGDHGLTADWRPPVMLPVLLVLYGALALAGRRLWIWPRWCLAALLLMLAVLAFANEAVARILDRPLDLYFDLWHVPNLLGLYLDAAGKWRGSAVVAAAAGALAALLALLAVALAAIEQGVRLRGRAVASILAGVVGLALIAVPLGTGGLVKSAVATAAWQQAGATWRVFAVLHGIDRRYAAMLAAPEPKPGPLPGLEGHDVYLIFVESYGTIGLDEPAYRAALAPALADFEATTKAAGYFLASSRVLSPTYGGGSWLAHGTMASGLKLDQLLSELVVNSDRVSLPRYLAAAGYRTVEVMPGIKQPDPEGPFWGFDRHYYGAELGYTGPQFGWFDIPDQYTLQQFSARELTPGHGPLYAQIVLVSSHTPFAPVPPYLADWSDAGKFASVPQADWARIYAQPDWSDLDQPYLDSIAYDLTTLGAWLRGLAGAPLVVILGDHQPPDLTRGGNPLWTVPIYVLSRDLDLVRPFVDLGYGEGAAPPRRADPEGMEKFLGEFLAAYGPKSGESASAPRQSPDAPASSRP